MQASRAPFSAPLRPDSSLGQGRSTPNIEFDEPFTFQVATHVIPRHLRVTEDLKADLCS